MMFQGSAHVGEEGYIRLLQQVGGRNINGLTSGSDPLLPDAASQSAGEGALAGGRSHGVSARYPLPAEIGGQARHRQNERATLVDAAPTAGCWKCSTALSTPQSPYFNTPFGRVADLDRLTLEDVRQFFLRWYGPNNATLVIGGDIQPAQTLAWVERYFAALPPSPTQTSPVVRPVTLKKSRYRTLVDRVSEPMLVLAYPTVSAREPDFEALDLLADQLGARPAACCSDNCSKAAGWSR